MSRTLRVLEADGWATKPVEDLPENGLVADEIDSNFLSMDEGLATAKNNYEVETGRRILVKSGVMSTMYTGIPVVTSWAEAAESPIGTQGTDSADIDPDGSAIACGVNYDPTNYIYLYRLNTSTLTIDDSVTNLSRAVFCVAYSPDGANIACGHLASPYVTMVSAGASYTVISGGPGASLSAGVNDIKYSPTDDIMAISVEASPGLKLFRYSDYVEITTGPTFSVGLRSTAFNRAGTILFVAYHNGTNHVVEGYDTSSWALVKGPFTLAGGGNKMGVSHDDTLLAVPTSGSPNLAVIDIATFTAVAGVPAITSFSYMARFSSDDSMLVIARAGEMVDVLYTADWSFETNAPTLSVTSYGAFLVNNDTQLVATTTNSWNATAYDIGMPPDASPIPGYEWQEKQPATPPASTGTLRVLTKAGWTPSSVPLTAEQVDDNFLYIQDLTEFVGTSATYPIGTAVPVFSTQPVPSNYLLLDGSVYDSAVYPDLADLYNVATGTFQLEDATQYAYAGGNLPWAIKAE